MKPVCNISLAQAALIGLLIPTFILGSPASALAQRRSGLGEQAKNVDEYAIVNFIKVWNGDRANVVKLKIDKEKKKNLVPGSVADKNQKYRLAFNHTRISVAKTELAKRLKLILGFEIAEANQGASYIQHAYELTRSNAMGISSLNPNEYADRLLFIFSLYRQYPETRDALFHLVSQNIEPIVASRQRTSPEDRVAIYMTEGVMIASTAIMLFDWAGGWNGIKQKGANVAEAWRKIGPFFARNRTREGAIATLGYVKARVRDAIPTIDEASQALVKVGQDLTPAAAKARLKEHYAPAAKELGQNVKNVMLQPAWQAMGKMAKWTGRLIIGRGWDRALQVAGGGMGLLYSWNERYIPQQINPADMFQIIQGFAVNDLNYDIDKFEREVFTALHPYCDVLNTQNRDVKKEPAYAYNVGRLSLKLDEAKKKDAAGQITNLVNGLIARKDKYFEWLNHFETNAELYKGRIEVPRLTEKRDHWTAFFKKKSPRQASADFVQRYDDLRYFFAAEEQRLKVHDVQYVTTARGAERIARVAATLETISDTLKGLKGVGEVELQRQQRQARSKNQ